MSRGGTFSDEVDTTVDDILGQVRTQGDAALLALAEQFDGVEAGGVTGGEEWNHRLRGTCAGRLDWTDRSISERRECFWKYVGTLES